MKQTRTALAAFACFLLCGAAQAQAQMQAARNACGPDAQKYCSASIGAGPGKVKDCLIDHQKEISDACYDFLDSALSKNAPAASQAPAKPAAASSTGNSTASSNGKSGSTNLAPSAGACRPDVAKFCTGITPGDGRIKNCLIDHQKEISDACYGYLGKQSSGGSISDYDLAGIPSPLRDAVYRARLADGRTVYSDGPTIGAVSESTVSTRGNISLPLR